MNNNTPNVSVIISTHNSCISLQRTLDSLFTQTYPLQQIEIIVVADGCTDNTVEILRNYRTPFTLHVIDQPGQGFGMTLNQGAAHANGSLLLFLGDDVESTPNLIKAHADAHQCGPDQIVIGPSLPVFQGRVDFIRMMERVRWEDKFYTMSQNGHRYSYRDLVSSNFSLKANLFAHVGRFDPTFRINAHADYDFGMRLIKAGVSFVFTAEALVSYHKYKINTLDCLLERSRLEGHADVLVGLRHPELRQVLPLANYKVPFLSRGNLRLMSAFRWPTIGKIFVGRSRYLLDLLEKGRLRNRWRQRLNNLLAYAYWHGVAEELGTRRALEDFLYDGFICNDKDGSDFEIDLCEGLEVVEQRLDEERPAGVCIRYGQQPVGRIPSEPGAERLRGVHLRPILAAKLAWPLIKALAVEGTFNRGMNPDHLLSSSIKPIGAINAKQSLRS